MLGTPQGVGRVVSTTPQFSHGFDKRIAGTG